MRDDNKFSLRHIIVALGCAIIGILCMWLGNQLVSNVGSVLLVSGIYTIIDNMYLKKSLIELVIQKEALIKCGRQDLIGFGKECLIAPRNIKQGRNTNTQYAKKHNDSSNTRQHRSDSKGRYSAGKRRK